MTVNRSRSAKRGAVPGSPSAVTAIRGRLPLRILLAGLLGVAAALLVACGGSGKGLIPTANAGPLQSDFEAVARAAQSGEGSCTATEAAIAKTETDFAALPSTVDQGLHKTLSLGIANLRRRALALCAQPLPQVTSTTSTPTTTTSTQTTPPTTTHIETPVTPTTPTTSPPTATTPGGGTPAPGSESQPGASSGPGGGTGIGGESGSGSGAGGSGTPGAAGGQENGK